MGKCEMLSRIHEFFVDLNMPLNSKEASLLVLGATVVGWSVKAAIPLVQEVSKRQLMDPEHYPKWSDLSTSAVWFAIFMVAHAFSFLILGPTARKLIQKRPYWTTEVWVAKLERFCSAIFQLGFSAVATFLLHSTLRQTSWLPPVLGGTGSTTNCWTNDYPYQEIPDALKKFYLIFIGYSSSEMVGHIIRERKRPDFYELLVHLLVTNCLLVFSYYGNYIRIGSLIMLAHSASDVFVYIAKALVDTKVTGGALSYIPLLVAYIWCRIYIHSATILKSIWFEAVSIVGTANGQLLSWDYLNFLLSILLMLHLYWLFVIVKIGIFLISTGKSRDLQASLSSLNVRQTNVVQGPDRGPSYMESTERKSPPPANGSGVVKKRR